MCILGNHGSFPSNASLNVARGERRRLKQAAESDADCDELMEHYDPDSRSWDVAVGGASSSSLDLGMIVGCARANDSIVLSLSRPRARVIVKRPIIVFEPITITASFDGSPAEAQLTCYDDNNPLFDIQSSGVLLENMQITDCHLREKNSPIIVRRDAESLTLRHTSFKDNKSLGNAAATIDVLNHQSSLNMTAVTFEGNEGGSSFVARLPRTVSMKNVQAIENKGLEVFHFPKRASVTVTNLTAKFNKATVITIEEGNLSMSDSILEENGNREMDIQGGAVALIDSFAEIKHCDFLKNEAMKGGAVFARNSTISISGFSNFTNNGAHEGGGCFFESSSATIEDSAFLTNNAENDGGAVRSTSTNLTLSHCQCLQNSAGNSGGCLLFEDASLTLNNFSVERNNAKLAGALKVERSNLTISLSRFVKNSASNTAGSFYFDDSRGEVIQSRFENNTAAYGGGAYVHACVDLLFRDTEFVFNHAVQIGGGVDVDIGAVEFSNVTLKHNEASLGGGLYFFNASVTGSELKFEDNIASEGGALMSRKTNITICVRNECDWKNEDLKRTTENSREKSFGIEAIKNIATNGGGALDIEESNMNITRGMFRGNKGIDGGALHLSSRDCIVRVNDSVFKNNRADTTGGAVYARATTEKTINVTFHNVSFHHNKAFVASGACSLLSVSSSFTNCGFTRSVADIDGGAIFIWQMLSEVEPPETTVIEHSFFEDNTAVNGAGIYARDRMKLVIQTSQMRRNRATIGKGAAVFGRKIVLQMYDVNLDENSAEGCGGGLFLNASTVEIQALRARKNSGEDGGAAKFLDVRRVAINDSVFEDNSARGPGGGIRLESSTVRAFNLLLIKNSAASGGGISANESKILCHDCNFKSNEAKGNGGAIEIESHDKPGISAQIVKSHFKENKAQLGGGIHFLKSYASQENCPSAPNMPCGVVIIHSSFVDNVVDKSGSAVHSNARQLISVYCSDRVLKGAPFLRPFGPSSQDPEQNDTCPSWYASKSNRPIVSTYANKVILDVNQSENGGDDVNDRYKIESKPGNCRNDKVKDWYCVTGFVPGREVPTIKVTPVDQYGNREAEIHGEFKPSLESQQLLEGKVSASKSADGKCNFLPVKTSHTTEKSALLRIDFDGAFNLDPVHIRVKPRKCMVGEIQKDSGVLCEACDSSTYSLDPGMEHCHPCPPNANCDGDFIYPKAGHWQRSPCDNKTFECLNSHACSGSYKDYGSECSASDGEDPRSASDQRSCALLLFTETLTKDCSEPTKVNITEEFQALQCSKGYEGPLCGACSEGYSQSGNYKCNRCSADGWYVAIILLAVLFTIAVVTVMIRGNHVSSTALVSAVISTRRNLDSRSSGSRGHAGLSPTTSQSTPDLEIILTDREQRTRNEKHALQGASRRNLDAEINVQLAKWKMCEIIKVIINFLQAIAMAAVINVEWAKFVRGLLQASDIASGAPMEAISNAVYCLCHECVIHRSELSYIIVLISPFCLVLLFVVFYSFKCFYKGYNMLFCFRRMLLSFFAILYLNYLNVTRQTVEVFVSVRGPHADTSENLDSLDRYWVADTSLRFMGADHKPLFALALIVTGLFSFGFPVMSAVTLYQSFTKKQLGSNGIVYDILGFMYRGYDPSYCYWESVIMLRKACLSIIAVFSYSLGGAAQGLLATFVLVICLFLHTWFHPFRIEFGIVNTYESYSLIVSCQTFILSSFFAEDNASGGVRAFLSAYLGMCIIGFMLYLVYELIYSFVDFLRVKLEATDSKYCRKMSTAQVIQLWWLRCMDGLNRTSETTIQLGQCTSP